jgi:hypothetical protein
VDRSAECGNPFDPIDHFYDAEHLAEKLYAFDMNATAALDLNRHLFDTTRYEADDVSRHDLRPYLSADAGAYGWRSTLVNLFHAAENTTTPLRYIRSIHSGRRREIGSTKRKIYYTSQAFTSEHVSTNEMDTHAATCCLGKTFVPLYYTGEVCNVHKYSNELDVIKDYILEIHQALMFTESLEHSLINPNQIRFDGHSLCDDPWDRHRSLGLV